MSCTHVHAEHGKITICSVFSEVYSALLALLRACSVLRKKRTPHVVAAYRINMKRIASCAMVLNPLSGQQEDRVVIDSSGETIIVTACNRIIVKYKFQVY